MKLTEAQISYRKEIFYELVEFLVNEEYEITEEYVTIEEDLAIANEIMLYFVESFKEPTLQESINSVMSGYDINEKLYIEIVESILLDESVGSSIAGAVHGIGSWNANRKATNAHNVGKAAASVHTAAMAKANAHATGASTGGILHKFKQTYLNTKVNKAKAKVDTAINKSVDLDRAAKEKQVKRSELSTKIDKSITGAGHKIAHIAAGGALGAKADTHTPEQPPKPVAVPVHVVKPVAAPVHVSTPSIIKTNPARTDSEDRDKIKNRIAAKMVANKQSAETKRQSTLSAKRASANKAKVAFVKPEHNASTTDIAKLQKDIDAHSKAQAIKAQK